jgi:transposase
MTGATEMPGKKYIIDLTAEERQELQNLIGRGKLSVRKVTRARILLRADEGWKDEDIAAALDSSVPTVERIRKRFVEGGLPKALNDDPRPGARRKLGARGEAYLIALACSPPPDDHDHWTLRLLADKLVELEVVDSISHEAVRQTLKKTR